jgi:hypothetical protein
MPLASLVEESGVGLRAEGDRALFEGGGYLLLEVLRLQGPALAAALRGLLPLLVLGLVLGALASATLLVALNSRGPLRPLEWSSRAAVRLPALGVLAVGTALAQGLALLLGALAAEGLPDPLVKPHLATALQLAPWLGAAIVVGALGGFADLTKAALIRYESSLVEALGRAWQTARARPLFGTFGWLPYAAPFLLAVGGVAWLTGALDVSRRGAWRVITVLLLHQVVVVVAVACRAGWYARALRGVCSLPAPPAPWAHAGTARSASS